jgi:hypothetical protein
MERRPAVKKISTVQAFGNEIFKEQKLTIGVDLGDRWSFYCVLDEAGKIILEQKLPTTPDAMKQTFSRIPQSRIALCGDGDRSLRSEEEKMPRNERWLPWLEKLAVLLHRLWVSGEVYEPLRNSQKAMRAVA